MFIVSTHNKDYHYQMQHSYSNGCKIPCRLIGMNGIRCTISIMVMQLTRYNL